jgi:maltooligosyltrehalose synthase
VVAVSGRFFTRLGVGREGALRLGREAWGDTTLRLEGVEAGRYRDVLTGREFDAGAGALPLAELLSPLPVALLARVRD